MEQPTPAPAPGLDRRNALKLSALGIAAGLLGVPSCASSSRAGASSASARRVARIAHFSDTHIQPELDAARGVAAALRHAQSLRDPPSLILTGGDLVMDAYEQPAERTNAVFSLLKDVLRQECSIPVHHTLGNHDIWGWKRSKSGLTGNEPMYGSAYAVDRLGLPGPYFSFDIGAGPGSWRVIVLDSVRPSRQPGSEGYEAFLDEPQFDWLQRTLRDTPSDRWVLVCSHIPIISVSSLFDNDTKIQLRVQSNVMHDDARQLHTLFKSHPNVRVALSGHIHQVDRCDYAGLTYICGGAVSGAWWKGEHNGCREGYGVVDLFSDGTFGYSYQTYGWQAARRSEGA
ncbi:MAG: metallophosphoesterase family protein [Phycisphaerales bacterium]